MRRPAVYLATLASCALFMGSLPARAETRVAMRALVGPGMGAVRSQGLWGGPLSALAAADIEWLIARGMGTSFDEFGVTSPGLYIPEREHLDWGTGYAVTLGINSSRPGGRAVSVALNSNEALVLATGTPTQRGRRSPDRSDCGGFHHPGPWDSSSGSARRTCSPPKALVLGLSMPRRESH